MNLNFPGSTFSLVNNSFSNTSSFHRVVYEYTIIISACQDVSSNGANGQSPHFAIRMRLQISQHGAIWINLYYLSIPCTYYQLLVTAFIDSHRWAPDVMCLYNDEIRIEDIDLIILPSSYHFTVGTLGNCWDESGMRFHRFHAAVPLPDV